MIQTAICIASGPSLTPEDVQYCQGKGRVYVVNDCHRLAPWADDLYACDLKWWDYHAGVPQFTGRKWTINKDAALKYGLNYVAPGRSSDVFIMHESKLALGSNSGYQVINLAAQHGAKRIILLGYDMKKTAAGKVHWFGDHPEAIKMESRYSAWCLNYDRLAPAIARHKIEVINCTRDSALNCFSKKILQDII